MSKADRVRKAWADPATKADVDQQAAARRAASAGKIAGKIRRTVADALKDRTEIDEMTLEILAVQLAALVSLDPGDNAALMHELLPAYVAGYLASERPE